MHPSRRRKKRPNYGIRTVEVLRGSNGFGFTISGQQPCILSCIVANSPAEYAGLRAGDFLISVNGISVSKIAHDAVVGLIGNCVGPIRMTIAENYYSDSSEEELDVTRISNARKPKYTHKPRPHHRPYKPEAPIKKPPDKPPAYTAEQPHSSASLPNVPMEEEAGPVEYKALVGYLGTIEMPKQLMPNSRLQTVCSCIRKLRQEKRAPTAVLMTIFPTCLTLKNSSNHILAIYPTNRVVYIGSTADRESRYFGLVTSAVCDSSNEQAPWLQKEEKKNNTENEIEISNSCHVFMIDPKIVEHAIHVKKAETFKISCTLDDATGHCLEFPYNALYIVNLVQNMYKLNNNEVKNGDESNRDQNLGPLVANSPQPSASSNSDSGIGFRDDCGNLSDRILVVEFPTTYRGPIIPGGMASNRPSAIDASSISLENLDLPLNNGHAKNFELNNAQFKCYGNNHKDFDKNKGQPVNLNNIRACQSVNIKNILEKTDNVLLAKQNNNEEPYNRLTCRAMPDRGVRGTRGLSPVSSDDNTKIDSLDTGQVYSERPVEILEQQQHPNRKFHETVTEDVEFQSSVDNISIYSSKSMEIAKSIFKMPNAIFFDTKKSKRQCKMVNSCDNFDKLNENVMNYKLSPKVYGLPKPNFSCEELNRLDSMEKHGYGSLQELCSWRGQGKSRRNIAQSEPDVRIQSDLGGEVRRLW